MSKPAKRSQGMRAGRRTTSRDSADIDDKLDEALDMTFPASDPIAVGGATSTEPQRGLPERKSPTIERKALAPSGRRPRRE